MFTFKESKTCTWHQNILYHWIHLVSVFWFCLFRVVEYYVSSVFVEFIFTLFRNYCRSNIFKISLRVGSDTFLKIFPPKKCFKKFASWSLSGDIKGEGLSERSWRHISKSLRSVRSLLLWIITLSLFFFLKWRISRVFQPCSLFLALSTHPFHPTNTTQKSQKWI